VWRNTRALVLARDGWVCQLCFKVIDPTLPREDPMSAQVHHLHGKRHGDDPRWCVASHRLCNQRVGDPDKAGDPPPRPRTRW
jgi:hypothetical protein